ncbi:MAG: AI-2E family transporter [Clostridia bacterium]|nr:AI-2E family transporter [Clostridia bacterium]
MQKPISQAFSSGNLSKTILILAFAAALILFWGDVIADALAIFFLACLLAFLVSPLAKLLEKKLKRPLAALLSLILVGIVLLLAIGFLAPMLVRESSRLLEQLPPAFDRLKALAEGISSRIATILPELNLPSPDFSGIESGFSGIAKGAISYVSGFAGAVYRISLSVVLCYFLMADREKVFLRCELMVPSAWRKNTVRFCKVLLRELRLYLRGQATIALSVGALSALGLTIVGVRGGILLGAIVGLFNMIPYFGPILGSIPAVLLALSDGWQRAAFAALVLFLVQQIDGMVISPRVMGNITGFSPAVVLIALFLGSRTGGVWGMLLAMPLLMAFRTLYRVFVQRYENN